MKISGVKYLSLIIIAIATMAIQGCKKTADPTPQTITKTVTNTVHDTVKTTVTQNVIEHDTVYCISKADIVSTWYCYKQANNNYSPGYKVVFTSDSAYFPSIPAYKITYSTDFSKVYYGSGIFSGTAAFTVYVNNCNELKIIDANGYPAYLRRLP